MKRFISILLLSTVLLTQTECYQLLKLPVIFQHYAEHRVKDRTISFSGFISMHYFHDSPVDDQDDDRDRQLPFKSDNGNMIAHLGVGIPRHYEHRFTAELSGEIPAPCVVTGRYILTPVADIWQPPRQV